MSFLSKISLALRKTAVVKHVVQNRTQNYVESMNWLIKWKDFERMMTSFTEWYLIEPVTHVASWRARLQSRVGYLDNSECNHMTWANYYRFQTSKHLELRVLSIILFFKKMICGDLFYSQMCENAKLAFCEFCGYFSYLIAAAGESLLT